MKSRNEQPTLNFARPVVTQLSAASSSINSVEEARQVFEREIRRLVLLDAVAGKNLVRAFDVLLREAAFSGPLQSVIKFDDDPDKTEAQKQAVLDRLRKAGRLGCTNVELNGICFRYGARIFDLRHDDGFVIVTTQEKGRVFRFTLYEAKV
jgi:hypothetical protein